MSQALVDGVPVQGSKHAVDSNPYRRATRVLEALTAITPEFTRTVRVRGGDQGVLGKARPERAAATGVGSHLTAGGDPVGFHHSIPTFLCREKCVGC